MLANKSLKALTKQACQHFQPDASAFFNSVHSGTQSKKELRPDFQAFIFSYQHNS